jgi:predicted dehydrogenase
MSLTRRELVTASSLAAGLGATGGVFSEVAPRPSRSKADRLNIACIGVGGQGASDVQNVSSENIVALCDVDERRAAKTFETFPDAKRYTDFRKMLEQKDIDAVTVTTPDHTHAVAAIAAMQLGKHVYVQKPLARTVSEVRALLNASRRHKVVTQMGTQNHSHESYLRLVEILHSGILGDVTEVHVWTDRPIWPQNNRRPATADPVPSTLNWDLWLGPAQQREYNKAYLPFSWRGWWDFGTGAIGDMACHLMDPIWWGLNLTVPTTVEAEGPEPSPDGPPDWMIVRYKFPKRGQLAPVSVTWYDGKKKPQGQGPFVDKSENGSLYIGTKGKVAIEHAQMPVFLTEGLTPPPPTLPRIQGHHKQWIDAIKNSGTTGSNFEYACPLTESALLGLVAYRCGKPIEWDARAMKAKGVPEADQYIRHKYRKGWSL